MADRGRGGGFGARGRGRGRGRGRRGGKSDEKEWQPVTKLGRLVKAGKINSMEEIYLHSLPIKEYQIVDNFLPKLKDEVMKIKPVQKQTRAGQRTRFKAIVIIGDSEGHVGLGIKTSKEVATAIRAAIIIAKLSVIPVRRGYWGTNLGQPHSLPCKESGKCGSVTVRVCTTLFETRRFAIYQRNQLANMYHSLSPLPVVLVSLPPPPSSVSSSSPVSKTPTPLPLVPPRLSRTPSRLPSLPSPTPTDSLPPTCGRRLSSSAVRWRSSLTLFARASASKLLVRTCEVARWGGLHVYG